MENKVHKTAWQIIIKTKKADPYTVQARDCLVVVAYLIKFLSQQLVASVEGGQQRSGPSFARSMWADGSYSGNKHSTKEHHIQEAMASVTHSPSLALPDLCATDKGM
ncbi:hypothetical protein E2C01_026478 [Portunus trituberculatus]|uniref:Uncharacterized protein n=1 Tax=Portunus trituberculatus TaxID=210409 RepID=A0A5B7EIV8_PORTR|nr:hypothetical protein [Portunus trituberculatus]